jgi:hypothetical protein
MFKFRVVHFCVAVTTAVLIFSISSSTIAFNPQPEPPGNVWRVEGFINMTALEILPTGAAMPFGVDSAIIDDDHIDFRVGVIATFTAADSTGGGKPDDGIYTPDMEHFRVQIGNTSWDETMPNHDLEFLLQDGIVTGVSVVITDTMPSHPDFESNFPASPGTWVATDDRDRNYVGIISGSYALMDGEVINRPQISVADGFIKLDATQGNVPGDSDCTLQDHYGRMVFDDSNELLYICSQSGWVTK